MFCCFDCSLQVWTDKADTMPAIFRNVPGAVLFFLVICVEAVTGCLIILFPLLPFMVLHPVYYRKAVDHLMILALGLPLVSQQQQQFFCLFKSLMIIKVHKL